MEKQINEFDINQFLKIPDDTKKEIMSFFTDPRQIMEFSNQSLYLKLLLYQSVTHLTIDENPYYLNVDFLNSYPFLKEVDDNIIFSFDLEKNNEIKIPRNLRKFNFRILVGDIVNLNNIIKPINNLLKQLRDINIYFNIPNLQQYTVRVMINNNNKIYKDAAFVIDQGNITFFNDLSRNNLFAERLNLDWQQIFDDLKLETTEDNESALQLYYMSYSIKNNDGSITTYTGDEANEMFIYDIAHLQLKLKKYTYNNNANGRLLDYYISQSPSMNHFENWTHQFFKSSLFSADKNVIISHLYLTQPSIMQIIKNYELNMM